MAFELRVDGVLAKGPIGSPSSAWFADILIKMVQHRRTRAVYDFILVRIPGVTALEAGSVVHPITAVAYEAVVMWYAFDALCLGACIALVLRQLRWEREASESGSSYCRPRRGRTTAPLRVALRMCRGLRRGLRAKRRDGRDQVRDACVDKAFEAKVEADKQWDA